MKYEIFKPLAIYHQGQRPNQEDSIYPELDFATVNDRLFIVCDGMGGFEKGEVASSTVCQAISRYINVKTDPKVPFTDNMMSDAMVYAYTALNTKVQTDADSKMGTTMAMLYFHAGGVMAAHIGDSRYYHIRPEENRVIYRSKDHSLVFSMFEAGEITEEEMATHENKNVILRAIMPGQETPQMPDIVHIKDVRPGDWFLIMSDGMVETLTDKEILNVLCNKSLTDEQKRDWFLAATNENNDNHSAYLIHISGVTTELVDRHEPDDEQEARANNPLFNPLPALAARATEEDKSIDEAKPESVVVVDLDDSSSATPQDMNPGPAYSRQQPEPMIQYEQGSSSEKKNNRGMILGAVGALIIVGAVFGFYFVNNKLGDSKDAPVQSIKSNRIDAVGGGGISTRTYDATSADPKASEVDMNSVTGDLDKLKGNKKVEKAVKDKKTETDSKTDVPASAPGAGSGPSNDDIINSVGGKMKEKEKDDKKINNFIKDKMNEGEKPKDGSGAGEGKKKNNNGEEKKNEDDNSPKYENA